MRAKNALVNKCTDFHDGKADGLSAQLACAVRMRCSACARAPRPYTPDLRRAHAWATRTRAPTHFRARCPSAARAPAPPSPRAPARAAQAPRVWDARACNPPPPDASRAATADHHPRRLKTGALPLLSSIKQRPRANRCAKKRRLSMGARPRPRTRATRRLRRPP